MNFKKTLFSFVMMFMFSSVFAGVDLFWNFGRISAKGVFSEDGAEFHPVLEIPELYIVGQKTGLYASFCPFTMDFVWAPEKQRIEGENKVFPWDLDSITFVNLNLGWMKNLSERLLLETSVRANAVNAMNIKEFCFSPTVELSWTPYFIYDIFSESPIPFMIKAFYLKGGADFYNTKNFKPDFSLSLGFDFIVFASLTALTGK